MIYFTADTHAHHTNIIGYCNRPFGTSTVMTNRLVENINNIVKENDTLYHLGDVSFGNTLWVMGFITAINCKNIHLILGNHDKRIRKQKELQNLFSSVNDYKEINLYNNFFILCHYPLLTWNKMRYNSIHLHGHCHGTLEKTHNRRIDVGVDVWNYKPVSIEEILDYVQVK